MAKSDSKFGTFGGVFTPSILTILGVIMYLRLPWVVGNSGLALAFAIIVLAHIVSVCTGLSISSIATDKSVGAGGPYYIVSRSLGLPIGGTLGLALFLGLSFSISLYIIGFSESFLGVIGVDVTPNTIRICGTVTVVLLTVITFISTSLAIKTQYLILGAILLSLISIFFGSAPEDSAPLIGTPEGGESFAVLFGIFFPAVTGFTAGVNMSGDLRDPKESIPTGTMAAIFVGLAVYLALAAFLAFRVPADELVNNPRILEDMSLWAPLVTAGIWGATLSSALGSILGAPRILQTISGDGITPRFFAKGHGKTNEPRNALLLAFAIGWAGILIAELDVIARVVSMVFMATYGFLNLAAAIESWVSPDFRPDFRIPKTISVVGAVVCLLLMIQMDLAAMAGALVVMSALFVYLQRRQLQLESGDAWEGIWSTLVRAGLHRLALAQRQQRNWRPNILMFRPDDGAPREALRRTAGSLITGNGMLTDIRLRARGKRPAQSDPLLFDEGPVVGVFTRDVETEDPYATMERFAAHHGYSGIEPNTALIDWDGFAEDGERLTGLIDQLRELDLNTLLFTDATHEPPPGTPPRIDVWWRADSTPALSISLIRFITSSPEHRRAAVRFITVSRDSSLSDGLRNATRRLLEAARVTADVEVILDTVDPKPLERHVCDRSSDATLAVVELPPPPTAPHLEALDSVRTSVPTVLFVSPSSQFEAVGRVVRAPVEEAAEGAEEAADVTDSIELSSLRPPAFEPLADEARAFAQRLEGTLRDFYQKSVARLGARNLELLARTETLVDRHFGVLAEGLAITNPVKRRRHINRVQSAFLIECRKLIDDYVRQDLPDQRDILEGRVRALLGDATLVEPHGMVTLERPVADFAASPSDSRELAKVKRARRERARGGVVKLEVETAPLQRWYVEHAAVETVDDTVRAFVTDSWHLAVQLLKVFHASRTSLTLIQGSSGSDEARASFVESERETAKERLQELMRLHENRIEEHAARLAEEARVLSQGYADDLDRVDLPQLLKSQRKLSRQSEALKTGLLDEAGVFYEHQKALFERAQIGLEVSGFQHRIATIVQRTREAIALEVKNGVLHGTHDLKKALGAFLEEERDEPVKLNVDLSHRFDPVQAVDALVREGQRSAGELAESVSTLSDASIQRLAEGDADEVEMVELPLKRLAQFLLDAQLVGPLSQLLAEVPAQEQQSVGVAEDVVRLIGFHQNEYDPKESAGGFHAHMRPVVVNGLERVEGAIAPLEAIVPNVDALLEAKLSAVLRGTDVYELTESARQLGQHIRRHQGQRAVSGAQSLALRGLERAREGLVQAIYGRSAGVLMARRLREGETAGALVERVSRFVEANTPSAEVLEDLPFYYRQLFFGKNTFNETFWVEREQELSRARRGIAQHARGGRGILVVTGEPDSGKTALCRRLTSRALSGREIHWVPPPEDGAADVEAFRRKLSEVTGVSGSVNDIVQTIPERSVLVIEDLELWWERSEHGLAVIDALIEVIEAHASRVLFLIEMGSLPFDLVNRFRPLADHALAVVECGPLPAHALKDIVTLRHGSTGITFSLDGTAESELSEWRLARLFSQHFTYSRGLVGTALTSWITHVEEGDDRAIKIRAPSRRDWEVLDRLRADWTAVLVQLLLHKRLTRERLMRVADLEGRELDRQLDALRRMGLIKENRQGVASVNRFVTHALIERLRERKVLP